MKFGFFIKASYSVCDSEIFACVRSMPAAANAICHIICVRVKYSDTKLFKKSNFHIMFDVYYHAKDEEV